MHATTIPPTIAAERKGYKVRADVLQVFILYFTFSPYHLRPFPPEVGGIDPLSLSRWTNTPFIFEYLWSLIF
jgi:hypothetical protein